MLLLTSCSTARITDSWVSKDYTNYEPKKVLIIGLTTNVTARRLFEEQLKSELGLRGIEAIESFEVFEPNFTNLKQSEEAIEKEVTKLSKDGYEAVLIAAVKGVDEKVTYSGDTYGRDYYWRRFGRYYYLTQDIYQVQGYYSKYKVYHVESSLFDLKQNNDKSLVWVASYDIIDPQTITKTVTNYVDAIIKSLEKEHLIVAKK
jgi:hypothetical protein